MNCIYTSNTNNKGSGATRNGSRNTISPFTTRNNRFIIMGVLTVVLIATLSSIIGIVNTQTTFTFDQTLYDKKWNDEQEIWFGQSTALTGQTRELGYPLMVGAQAAFKEVNELGGVWGGKKLRLYSVDDGYEPARCVNNTLVLLNNQTIFGFIGFMGTGTSQAILNLLVSSKIPYVGALTGGLFLRYPFVPNIINVRASYQDEMAAMVEYLVNVKMVRRISIFYQNDAFGMSGVDGSILALKPLGMNLTSLGTYERNTINVAQAVNDIAKGNPQAIICMSTYKPTVAFINAVKERGDYNSNIIFMTGSFIGSNLLPYRSSIVITQVYPEPTNAKYPIVLSYRRAMEALNPQYTPSLVELEGYMAAKLVISVLTQRVSGDLTRANFINLIYSAGTYILDNQVVGPYTKCTTVQSRRGLFTFEEQTNPMISHSLTASLAPSIQLKKRDLRVVDETHMSTCSCNQGLRSVWKTIQNADSSFTEIGDPMTWDLPGSTSYTCFFDPSKISLPIIFGHTSDGSTYDNEFLMGLLAAFKDRNDLQKGVRGRRVEVLSVTESSNSSSLISATTSLITDHNIVGLVGSKASESVMKQFIGEFASTFPKIVMISPSAGYDSPKLRSTFYNNVALVQLSVRERMLSVLNYCMNTLGFSRFSFVGSNGMDGQTIFSEFTSLISAFGFAIDSSYLFSMDQSLNSSSIASSLSTNANPQAIIVSIPEDVTNFKYLKSVLEGIKSIGLRSEIHVFCLYFRQVSWEAEISNLLSNPSMSTVKFYISQAFPYLKTKHTLIDSYTSIMAKYYSTSPTTIASVEGFLVGSFIIEVLDNIPLTSAISGQTISETLYTSKEFLKYQIPFGKFISGSCNQGMKSHFTYQYSGTSFTLVDNFVLAKEKCGAQLDNILSSTNIKPPIIFGGLYPSSYRGVNLGMVTGIQSLFTKMNEKGTLDREVHIYTEYYDNDKDLLVKAKSLIEKNKVFALLGSRLTGNVSSLRELVNSYQITMIGSISGHPELRYPYSRYIINLRPNIVEEVVTATRFATSTLGLLEPTVKLIHSTDAYWSSVVSNITYFYKTSQEGITLSYMPFPTPTLTRRATVVSENLGDVVVVLASAMDTKDFLKSYQGQSRMIIIPSEVISAIEMKGVSLPNNVVSTSYLSHYSNADNTNILAHDFLIDYKNYFPLLNTSMMEAYEGYAVATMASTILTYMQQVNIEKTRSYFTNSLFQKSAFELGDDSFGPYGDTCLTTSSSTTVTRASTASICQTSTTSCGCNQGVKHVYLHFSSTPENTTYRLSIDTCGLKPLIPGLSVGVIVGIAVGASCLVIGSVIVLSILIGCLRRDTSLKFAPKSGYITCAFTDVQNSTKLWQGNEKAMRESLEIHNQIMRNNLKVYRGYEVKTNGDSFYVAFKDPYDAVLWAMAIQLDLLNAKWPSDLYHEWDCRQEWDSKTKKAYWSGLRVRIGLHYGKGDCVFDKTMKRFDYFGTVVNKSARIEALAHGGQVCISEELFFKTRSLYNDVQYLDEANIEVGYTNFLNVEDTPTNNSISLTSSSSFSKRKIRIQDEKKFFAADLGVYPLKGLSESSRIFEIKSPEIQSREYPPLRVDLGELERTRSRSNSMYTDGSQAGSQNNLYQQLNQTTTKQETARTEEACEYSVTSVDNTLHP